MFNIELDRENREMIYTSPEYTSVTTTPTRVKQHYPNTVRADYHRKYSVSQKPYRYINRRINQKYKVYWFIRQTLTCTHLTDNHSSKQLQTHHLLPSTARVHNTIKLLYAIRTWQVT